MKATQRVLAPVLREARFGDLQKRRRIVAARVVNRHGERRELFGLGDEALRIRGTRGIADDEGHFRVGFVQLGSSGRELLGIASGDDDRMPSRRKSSSDRCTQTARCADTHDEYARLRWCPSLFV